MRSGRIISCLLGLGLSWFLSSTTVACAEEVAVRYQVLKTLPGLNHTTWSLKLELRNLSGSDLNKLSVSLLTSLPFIQNANEIGVGTLYATEPQTLIADFDIENDSLPPSESPLGFILKYQTTDGVPRSAMIQGQSAVQIGEAAP